MTGAVIDCHGHYTTSPPQLASFRKAQTEALDDPRASRAKAPLHITDEDIPAADRDKVMNGNARRVYPRLRRRMA